jgi:hypothetical protein
MANKLSNNPIAIDTFNADFTITTRPLIVNAVGFYSGTATDKVVIRDKNGDPVIKLIANVDLHFAQVANLNNPPYTIAAADCTVGAGGLLLIYQ